MGAAAAGRAWKASIAHEPPPAPPEVGAHEELTELLQLEMERTGLRASQTCMGWALAVVAEARRKGRLEKPEGVTLGDKLLNLEADVYTLFNHQFQVRPPRSNLGAAARGVWADSALLMLR